MTQLHTDPDPTPPHGTPRPRPKLITVLAVIAAVSVVGFAIADNTDPEPDRPTITRTQNTPSNTDVLELVWDGMPATERAEVCVSLELLGNELAYIAMTSEMDTMSLSRTEFDAFFAVHC